VILLLALLQADSPKLTELLEALPKDLEDSKPK
jgi:hypothetical protein